MNSKVITCATAIVAFCLFVAGSPVAVADGSKHLKREASGWLNRTAFDLNENGSPLTTVTTIGNGVLGKSMNNEVGEVGSFVGNFCEFDPAAGIIIVEIPMLSRSRIMRFSNGDMLFATLATDGSVSRLCVDVNTRTTTTEVHYVITGGTGKFEGATGWYMINGESHTVLREADFPVHVAVTQKMHGEIQRAKHGK